MPPNPCFCCISLSYFSIVSLRLFFSFAALSFFERLPECSTLTIDRETMFKVGPVPKFKVENVDDDEDFERILTETHGVKHYINRKLSEFFLQHIVYC